MEKIQLLIDKLNTIVIIKISLLFSLIIEFSLLYLNSIIEGNINYTFLSVSLILIFFKINLFYD